MNSRLIMGVLAVTYLAAAQDRVLAAPFSDSAFVNGVEVVHMNDDPGFFEVTINFFNAPGLSGVVVLYDDPAHTIVSDEIAHDGGTGNFVFLSDPQVNDPTVFPGGILASLDETGGLQDVSSFFGLAPGTTLTVQSELDAVPEPATIVIFGIGILGIAGYGWRRRKCTSQICATCNIIRAN